MKKVNHEDFKVTSAVELSKIPTHYDLKASEKKIEDELEEVREKLGELQDTLYAHGKYAVLVCLQGMDTAGKDSLIREVFKDFNTRGIIVHSFKVPTALELDHDYLWRHYIALPQRGKFGVFNRTHYENVLVTRVHPEYIMNENLPGIANVEDITDEFWDKRFEQIRNFEQHIAENGTLIYKFYLHLSKEEQKHRLLRRLEKKEKNWKFSAGDLKERKLWDQYQSCYQDAINRTSKTHAPWYVIPADDKPTARYIVARILYDTLKTYKDIKEPELDVETMANLEEYKKQLENE
ncbi:polyphosphate kinase 2 family protein [Aquimarina sp. U1-2]|uniref:PPK2 family polyphosphate kinase n=1 Tax=Aquimarina sp. U1-2 TaxID=2823141 RepID=UPI001AECDA79|nr:PPK2 family polyphosphate kinase [Aquimarina sp. U1-2]MBP2834191.1 polyphosphate kinase 2 family protein [Aquimarina sp. U1-2]